jgi:hypothetical protein
MTLPEPFTPDPAVAAEHRSVSENRAVYPGAYTKPFRVYCDVDGVVMPFITSQESIDQLDGSGDITVFNYTGYGFEKVNDRFYFKKKTAEFLSELSHRDDVDFVWLTAWRENAPYALDALLGVESVGYLDWKIKRSDFSHRGKGEAILEDQKESPSKFIWLDDFANRRESAMDHTPNLPFFTKEELDWPEDDEDWNADPVITLTHGIHPAQYLAITTDSYVGLVDEHFVAINNWIDENN